MTATPLFTTTIGSHLWGHATAASDIDHLEVYAADPREILTGVGPTRGKAQRMIKTADGLYLRGATGQSGRAPDFRPGERAEPRPVHFHAATKELI